MSVYKNLYETANDKFEVVDESLTAMQEIYGIPQDVIDRHRRYENDAINAWTTYWGALCEPFWTTAWRNLFRKK